MTDFPDIPGWEQFESRLRIFIQRRVPADAVDDVYADVILRLLTHRDKLEAARNPVAWVLRVTANRIADYYRERAREPVQTGMEIEELQVAGEEHDGLAVEELADCILPLIKRLPARYGEALMLTEIEGMKQVDAARKLKLSPSGMKSRVQRGRGLLKKTIEECCHVIMDRKGRIQDFERKECCC